MPQRASHIRWLLFLPLVRNIFFKLALGSFEENPDIVEKRVRAQGKKKERETEKGRPVFFSACFILAIQAKKNKHPDSATDREVPWLGVVPKLGLPPNPLLCPSRESSLSLKKYGIASFLTLPLPVLIMFPCGWTGNDWTIHE